MKILLILPNANIHRLKFGNISVSFREAPLTLTTLAALIPASIKAEITLIDESIQKVPFEENFDLVGISCLTGTAPRAYEIARIFKTKGSTVILGGVHVTLMPQEALVHAHSIVIGLAEQTWPLLLKDFIQGQLKRIYSSKDSILQGLPLPRRDLQKRWSYLSPNTIRATSGCRGACDFCTIPALPYHWQTRPINEVIHEIQSIKAKRIVFSDVSLLEDREYAKKLFQALIPLKKIWGGLTTTKICQDDEMLELLAQSGCKYLLIGFESVSQQSLAHINKSFNHPQQYLRLVKKLHDYGIIIQGCFIFGLDSDSSNIFKETVEMVNELRIDIPRFAIYTPYPKTKAFLKLKQQKRILHENWQYYDTQHVVFQPAQMSPEQLDEGFKWAYKKTFKMSSIERRIFNKGSSFLIKFFGNLAYKIYVKRLEREENRLFIKTRENLVNNKESHSESELCVREKIVLS